MKQLYFNPKLTGSFSGLRTFAKQRKIPYKEAEKDLNKLKEYFLYKPARKTFNRRPVVVHFPNYQITFDLIDKQKIAEENRGFKYILIVLYTFTKYAYAEPLKSKSAVTVIKAFKNFFKRMRKLPKFATADAGKEWINKAFFKFMCNGYNWSMRE